MVVSVSGVITIRLSEASAALVEIGSMVETGSSDVELFPRGNLLWSLVMDVLVIVQ